MIRLSKAGQGTYGIVYNGETTGADKRKVAVKRNIVDDSVSFSGSIKELDLLTRLKGHPYIVKLLNVSFCNPFSIPNSPIGRGGKYNYREDYLHFIFEQGNNNGHSLIYSDNIPMCYLKLSMVQMFLGIEYMHSQGVIHRDIKPTNLLWFVTSNNKAAIKLCDFGLAKVHTPTGPMTPRVVTCWYRAPEICSRDPHYGYSSDIWSAGCVMFEMAAKRALLVDSVDDDVKLLSRIVGLIPNPTYEEIYKITKGHKIILTSEASPRHRHSFKELMGLSDDRIKEFNQLPENGSTYEEFLDLLDNILVLDPEKRYTATQILDHKFFDPYRDIVKWCRENHPPVKFPSKPDINIVCCRERSWACKTAFLIFNNRGYLEWYKHAILFQSIDMFDRYLWYKHLSKDKRLKESKYQGKYLTRYQTELYYVVCLYVCIKYFTTLHIPISFTELATDNYKTPQAMIQAEEFEKKMLKDVLNYEVYRKTIYEMSCDNNVTSDKSTKEPDEYAVRDMLEKYGNIRKHYTDINIENLYKELI